MLVVDCQFNFVNNIAVVFGTTQMSPKSNRSIEMILHKKKDKIKDNDHKRFFTKDVSILVVSIRVCGLEHTRLEVD